MKTTKKIILCIAATAAIFLVLNVPVTTKQGVNFVVVTKKIPLYVKICGFLYRDYQYDNLSRNVVRDLGDDRGRIQALYEWTAENIRRNPEGLPVVDDHIWNIVVRGYGTADQMADVFTTLASYAGYEAFWLALDHETIRRKLFLSFVKMNDKWYAFDVYNNEYFITADDQTRAPSGATYSQYIERIDSGVFLNSSRRPDKQKIIPRLIFELKKAIYGHRDKPTGEG